jgi:hypothetical protein
MQVLDVKGGKSGFPQRGAALSYYDYLRQGTSKNSRGQPTASLAGQVYTAAAA